MKAAALNKPDRNELIKLQAENELLRQGIESVRALMDQSEGVSGLHLNGDVADWDSLQDGGHFESWLMAFNEAEDAIKSDEPLSVITGFESTMDDLSRLTTEEAP